MGPCWLDLALPFYKEMAQMVSGAKGSMHNDFASQGGFHEMVHFPKEDLPAVKECKGPWAQSPPERRMALQHNSHWGAFRQIRGPLKNHQRAEVRQG